MDKYNNYKIKLTPNVFADLLIKFFDGKQFSRQQAIEKIINYHEDNGGISASMSGADLFKAAKKNLRDKGIKNIGYGVWRLNYTKQEIVVEEDDKHKKVVRIKVDKEIGKGKGAIYVYYYDIYKKYAENEGKSRWECKVGKSDVEAIERISNQTGTSYPELPNIGLIIYCSNPQQLESAIHQVLKIRGRWIENAPGKEWFNTNPMEVEDIYELIYKEEV